MSAELLDFPQCTLTRCERRLPCPTPHPCPQRSAWLVRWFQTGVLGPADRAETFQSPEPWTLTWSGPLTLSSLGSRCPALAPPVSGVRDGSLDARSPLTSFSEGSKVT